VNVVGELYTEKNSCGGFLATARLSCQSLALLVATAPCRQPAVSLSNINLRDPLLQINKRRRTGLSHDAKSSVDAEKSQRRCVCILFLYSAALFGVIKID